MTEKDYHYMAGDLKKEQDEMNKMAEKEATNKFTEIGDTFLTILCC